MQKPTLKKVGKRALQIVLPVAILLWIIYAMRDDWHQLATYKFQWNPWLVVLAFIGFLLQELSYGLIWRAVLARLGSHLALRTCLRIYLASEFVRYIPGNVWHVLTRILWVGKYSVSRPIAFASMMVELITKLAAGAFVFAVSLLFWGDVGVLGKLLNGTPILALLGVGTMFALLVGLHPRVLNGLMNGALHLLKRDAVVLTLRYRDILLVTLAWCASWFVAGCACFVLLLALWPAAPLIALPLCIGIYALVWDIGFVSFITPSGLGIREGAMVGLFALVFPLPLGLSAILAVVSRVVSTLAELICVGIAYLSGRQQMRAVQQQQFAQPATPKDEEEGPATDEHLYEASEQIDVVKGGVVSD